MANYLSGERIQGSSTAVSDTTTTTSQSGTGENKGLFQTLASGTQTATKIGFNLTGSHSLIGRVAKTVSLYIWKDGSPTGNGSMKIYNSSGVEQVESTNTVSWSGLGTSAWGVKTDFTFTGHTITDGDRFVIEGGSGNDSNRVFMSCNTSSATGTKLVYYHSGGWNTTEYSNAVKFDVVSSAIVDEKSTITNVPAGTRYEETNTRKIFYRAGTPFLTAWLEKGTAATLPIARGCWAGGNNGGVRNVIDYITIASVGAATDFGDLLVNKNELAGLADATRGCWGGGHDGNYVNVIEYITVASVGNGTDFGDLTVARQALAACADSTRGVWAGGSQNVIDYVTIQTTGNATDFGDLSVSRSSLAGLADATRGCFGGGYNASNIIDYITIQTTGNATDFGDMAVGKHGLGACSDTTSRGCFGGGTTGSVTNVIDYITISTLGNGTDFGDLTVARNALAACASQTRGCWGGGHDGSASDVIDYITIATTGNATDFGDLTAARNSLGALAA